MTLTDQPLRIVQVSTYDIAGGAENIARSLHDIYRERGHWSRLVVGYKRGADPDTILIDNRDRGKGNGLFRIAQETLMGRQYLDYPGSHLIPQLIGKPFDIVHCHNLHGGYFDLAALPQLATLAPVILMLHDAWLLTGHCAHFFGCNRWRVGCGQCPDLSIPPAIHVDGTHFNWQRKRQILTSQPITVTTPSQWMLDQAKQSYLQMHPAKLIYNGVDQRVFRPGSKVEARRRLELPKDKKIVLFLANSGLLNIWKDGATLVKALQLLLRTPAEAERPVIVALGGNTPRPASLEREVRRVARWILNRPNEEDILSKARLSDFVIQRGTIRDTQVMAEYYRAADTLAYATRVDNCPLTILEALSCGLPVIASAVGGVPELIRDGETGILVPPGDAIALTQALRRVLKDNTFRERLSTAATEHALGRFGIERQATEYLDLYVELIAKWRDSRLTSDSTQAASVLSRQI